MINLRYIRTIGGLEYAIENSAATCRSPVIILVDSMQMSEALAEQWLGRRVKIQGPGISEQVLWQAVEAFELMEDQSDE